MKYLFEKGNKINLGKKQSLETIEKRVSKLRGKPRSDEIKRKIGLANKINMKKLWNNSEYKKMMLINHKIVSFKGKHHSEKTKKKMSLAKKGKITWIKGKHHTEETKNKISQSLMGNIAWNKGIKGEKSHSYGKIFSEERKKRISQNKKGKYIGEKNWNWKGGISDYPYPEDWTETLRKSIRERDNYTCQLCGIHQDELEGWNKQLDCHHIDYNKNNLNPDNLISLCRQCHQKTNFNREYWIEYFNNKFKVFSDVDAIIGLIKKEPNQLK